MDEQHSYTTMEALSRAYSGLREFVDHFANSTSGSDTASDKSVNCEAWYAECDDNYLGDLLDAPLVRSILRRVADSYYSDQLDALLDEAAELTADNYPRLYEIYTTCCSTLGMHTPPVAYVTGKMRGINALSLEVKGEQFILVSPKAAICLPADEQAFLLGHELGHHQQGNLVCHTVNGLLETLNDASQVFGPLVLDTIEVPLKRWCRRSEFNADRAGYICCQNPAAVKYLFLRLGLKPEVPIYDSYRELETSHPLLHTRWITMQEYIKTFVDSANRRNDF